MRGLLTQAQAKIRMIAALGVLCFYDPPVAKAVVVPALDYFIIQVNEEPHIVHQGETLKVVRGDNLWIKSAALNTSERSVETVDLLGYARSNRPGVVKDKTLDDRAVTIDTGEELQPKFSLDGKGFKYRIVAKGPSGPYGEIFLELTDPEFRFAEVMVNRQLRVVRAGDVLDLAPTDNIKVRRVVTNVFDLKTVRFQIETKNGFSEMQLFRGHNVFARIPVSSHLTSPGDTPASPSAGTSPPSPGRGAVR